MLFSHLNIAIDYFEALRSALYYFPGVSLLYIIVSINIALTVVFTAVLIAVMIYRRIDIIIKSKVVKLLKSRLLRS